MLVRECTTTALRQFLVSFFAYMKVCNGFPHRQNIEGLMQVGTKTFGFSYSVSKVMTALVVCICHHLIISVIYKALSHKPYVMYTKFLHGNLAISLYNTNREENTVGHYY